MSGFEDTDNWVDCTTLTDAARGYEVQTEVNSEKARYRHRKNVQTPRGTEVATDWVSGLPPKPEDDDGA